jgi:hypothetical protein
LELPLLLLMQGASYWQSLPVFKNPVLTTNVPVIAQIGPVLKKVGIDSM